MNGCVCNGVYSFVKAYEDGKVPKDIKEHICACGVHLYIINGAVWNSFYPLTTKKVSKKSIFNLLDAISKGD